MLLSLGITNYCSSMLDDLDDFKEDQERLIRQKKEEQDINSLSGSECKKRFLLALKQLETEIKNNELLREELDYCRGQSKKVWEGFEKRFQERE